MLGIWYRFDEVPLLLLHREIVRQKKHSRKMEEVKSVLAIPGGLEVIDIEVIDEVLTIITVSTQIHPCCPLCGTPAARVHNCYCRQAADLPYSGQQVRLLVQVHKCFYTVPSCVRKIFVERLTPFVQPWARVTQRLYQIVQILGLATGSRLGVRVTDRLGIETTHQTILRRIIAPYLITTWGTYCCTRSLR